MLTPAAEAKSASDEAASGAATVAESIDELRDALQNGIPHRRVLNLRQVMPCVGQNPSNVPDSQRLLVKTRQT